MDCGWAALKGNSPLSLLFGLLFLCDLPLVRLRHPKAQLTHWKSFMFLVRIQIACIFCWTVIERIPIAVPAAIL
jgi:hypothetical protein